MPTLAALREEDIRACRAHVASSAWSAGSSARTPIVATYTTMHPGKTWRLGISAALHGLPLVIGGMGGERWGLFGQSNPGRVHGSRRMFEVLHALRLPPAHPVMFVDSGDVVIVRRELAEPVPRGVVVSAECTSYPKCYGELYAAHVPTHADCLARGLKCYANSGGYVASDSGAMLRLLTHQARG